MGEATPASLVVPIRGDWDSTLTYDSLDHLGDGSDGADGPVFVGRRDLLDPLVSSIRQPTARGTYLLSGYRGTGKTTLLIEALRQGALKLPKPWRLFPLVLNVSEVSASLRTRSGDPDQGLTIDPRRLLIALLRTLQHRVERVSGSKVPELADLIGAAYAKATAVEFSHLVSDQFETTRTAIMESGVDLKIANLYKVVSLASGLGAAALAQGALGTSLGAVYAGAAVLAGLSATSWYMSRKVTVTTKDASSQARSLKYDNSLQQLESDLKDILAKLHEKELRTVVVLEELDKIEDERGDQLNAVIRYFKNLFTQAPALFFFVTDKTYFDFISSQIKQSRRRRSYAIEHTFFTHRVFVGRPTTRDCLDYLRAVVIDSQHKARIQSMYTPKERLARSLQDLDSFGRLMRVLLFRASNHLFDLKNEMRHFTRTFNAESASLQQGGPYARVQMVVDGASLPEDQAAVAVLQDCVEEKARSFALASGRTYANEVLRDCLYSVFNELGSTRVQRVSEFYPYPSAGKDKATPGPQLLLEEQLELNESERIKQAVTSLIADLHRGGAFHQDTTDATLEFLWKPNAAGAFRYVRKLERHEEELAFKLRQISLAVGPFKPDGVLEAVAPDPAGAEALVQRLNQRAVDISNSRDPLTAEVALEEGEARRAEFSSLISDVYVAQMDRLVKLCGLQIPPDNIGPSISGGGVHLVQTGRGDPRFVSGRVRGSALLIVQGDGERLEQDVREFVAAAGGLERLALIHVVHAPGDQTALPSWEKRWSALSQPLQVRSLVAKVLPLDEGLTKSDVSEGWGRALAREILFRALWIGDVSRVLDDPSLEAFVPPEASVRVARVKGEIESTWGVDASAPVLKFGAALQDWMSNSDSRILWIGPPSFDVGFDLVLEAFRRDGFRDAAILESPSYGLVGEARPQFMVNQVIAQSALSTTPPPGVAKLVADLLADGSFVGAWRGPIGEVEAVDLEQVLGAKGRAIVQVDSLPLRLIRLGATKLDVLPPP